MNSTLFCFIVTGFYLCIWSDSAIQLIKSARTSKSLSLYCFGFRFQETLNILSFLFSSCRVFFFVLASKSWNFQLGQVSSNTTLFYTLDELSTVLFLCIVSSMISFWAELYYLSTNNLEYYRNFVRPGTITINVMALLGVPICSYQAALYTKEEETSYVFLQYTFLVVACYCLAILVFGYYSYMSARELQSTPLQLVSRKYYLFNNLVLCWICTVALVLRTAVFLLFYDRPVVTDSLEALVLLFMYFLFTELVPLFSIKLFYRVEELADDGNLDEDIPLLKPPGSRQEKSLSSQ